MRQPKIYISLPSKGKFWPEGSINLPETGQLPVYSMTARDELMFKTPDALMNGQAVVDVIQSCLPNIKNAWAMPTLDLDTVLVAIRLATYGEHLPLSFTVPGTTETVDYTVDLKPILDQQQNNHWIEQVVINEEFIIFLRPLTYKHLTKTNITSFETTRIMSLVNDETLEDEKKLELFNQSFSNLTKVTVDLMAESVFKVIVGNEEVTDRKYINEFVSNCDKDIFKTLQDHLNNLKEHNGIKPLKFETTQEQRDAGAPDTFEVPINFNDSDFFG